MKTLTKDMKIFSYRTEPLNGMEGDDGGFSIELYGNGNLRYCVYRLFDDIRLLQMFKVSKEAVYDIYGIIEKARKRLEQVPQKLDNGSEDGMLNEFFNRIRSYLKHWWIFLQCFICLLFICCYIIRNNCRRYKYFPRSAI